MVIRLAHPTDAVEVTHIARAAYHRYVERMGVEPRPMRDDYLSLIDDQRVWVAERGGAVVALIVMEVRPDHLYVDNVAVEPRAQASGVGTALLSFADDHARERGLAEVRLFTNELMTENVAFYPRRGYVETHRATEGRNRHVYFAKPL